jgi:hypothetical protein
MGFKIKRIIGGFGIYENEILIARMDQKAHAVLFKTAPKLLDKFKDLYDTTDFFDGFPDLRHEVFLLIEEAEGRA